MNKIELLRTRKIHITSITNKAYFNYHGIRYHLDEFLKSNEFEGFHGYYTGFVGRLMLVKISSCGEYITPAFLKQYY